MMMMCRLTARIPTTWLRPCRGPGRDPQRCSWLVTSCPVLIERPVALSRGTGQLRCDGSTWHHSSSLPAVVCGGGSSLSGATNS
jgi:hypothetical protein